MLLVNFEEHGFAVLGQGYLVLARQPANSQCKLDRLKAGGAKKFVSRKMPVFQRAPHKAGMFSDNSHVDIHNYSL